MRVLTISPPCLIPPYIWWWVYVRHDFSQKVAGPLKHAITVFTYGYWAVVLVMLTMIGGYLVFLKKNANGFNEMLNNKPFSLIVIYSESRFHRL